MNNKKYGEGQLMFSSNILNFNPYTNLRLNKPTSSGSMLNPRTKMITIEGNNRDDRHSEFQAAPASTASACNFKAARSCSQGIEAFLEVEYSNSEFWSG